MSTRFPLVAVLFQFAEIFEGGNVDPSIAWYPWLQNIEAVALSNMDAHDFDTEKEIIVDMSEFTTLNEYAVFGTDLLRC